MKKIGSILKNKEIMNRIMFTILILFVFRIGAQITVPGVTLGSDLQNYLDSSYWVVEPYKVSPSSPSAFPLTLPRRLSLNYYPPMSCQR